MSSVAVSSADFRTNLRGLWKTMRPQQWTKNAVVYAALIFDGKLFAPDLFRTDDGDSALLLSAVQQRVYPK